METAGVSTITAQSGVSPLPFKTPCSILVAGSSQCGKSVLIEDLISERKYYFDQNFDQIFFFYGIHTETIDRLKKIPSITFIKNLPTQEMLSKICNTQKKSLVVLDDLQCQFNSNNTVLNSLAMNSVSHGNITLICSLQTLYSNKSESQRILRLNSQYIILFKNRANHKNIITFASQAFPTDKKFFLKAFSLATNIHNYSPLLVDFHPSTKTANQLRGNFMKGQQMVIYRKN